MTHRAFIPPNETIKQWNRYVAYERRDITDSPASMLKKITGARHKAFVKGCKISKKIKAPTVGPKFEPRAKNADPSGLSPLYAIQDSFIAVCDGRDPSTVGNHQHRRKNGMIFFKVVITAKQAHLFEYMWHSDTRPSVYVYPSGLMKKEIQPVMFRAWASPM